MTEIRRNLHAIETRYAGCQFRSRLEARWAVFFDVLGITWEYEPQGYVCGGVNPRRYLPDFWLPQTETWAEVKGSDAAVDWDWLADACDWGSALPGVNNSLDTTRGLLLLGPIPAGACQYHWRHIGIQHYKGLIPRYFGFSSQAGLMPVEYPLSPGYGDGTWGWHWCSGNTGRVCAEAGISLGSWDRHVTPLDCGNNSGAPGQPPSIEGVRYRNRHLQQDQRVRDAYAAARSARFEHGQSGAVR